MDDKPWTNENFYHTLRNLAVHKHLLIQGCDRELIGPVELLSITTFNISKIGPKSIIGQVKAKSSRIVCFYASNVNTLRLRQKGRHFPGDNLKWIFLKENIEILIRISQRSN